MQQKLGTLSEMGANKFVNAKTMLRTYQNIDEESKEIVLKTLSTLFTVAKSNIKIKKPTIYKKGKNNHR